MFSGQEIRKKRKSLGLSAKALSAALEIKVENLYKWENGTKPTDPEDYIKIENWLSGKLETVPRETTLPTPAPPPSSELTDLIASNRMMAEAMIIDARNRENLTEANRELAKKVTASAPEQNQQDAYAMRSAFLELLGQVGSGKRWKSPEEVKVAYNKFLVDAMGLTTSKDTQKSLDKPHTGK
jgi:transcriptional regulator with XRE-family HTH domain